MLIVARHGRTARNAARQLLGRLDPPLDELGEAQAAALADALAGRDRPLARIVASPLRRTRQTAEAAAAVAGVPVELDDRWIELDYGELDGVALADVPAELWARWRADLSFRPPGGETLLELGARVRAACEDLVADAHDGDVLVVTHVSPVKAAVCWALGVGDEAAWRTFVAPASVARLAVGPHGPSLHGFGEVAHLDGLA